ncbi:hypothetical protein NG2371_00718 [Nocardia gamkensis]|nr:hypothetical protein [Nocardia gamkensis]
MGLFIAFAVPLVAFFAVVFWPQRTPKQGRERIEREETRRQQGGS